jgi:adenylate kinase family enzyme
MQPAYLFIGQSGAGKGTQIKLLQDKLLLNDPAVTFFHLETGDKFRELIEGTSYTSLLTQHMMARGELPPAFLGVHMWSHELIDDYDGKATVFIDGTPRVADEVPLLLSAAKFYGWTIDILCLHVSDQWSYDRIKGRGRDDDQGESRVTGRIAWYHTAVEPAIELLRQSELVRFHDINGEQTVEQVHKDVCGALGIG